MTAAAATAGTAAGVTVVITAAVTITTAVTAAVVTAVAAAILCGCRFSYPLPPPFRSDEATAAAAASKTSDSFLILRHQRHADVPT